MAGLFSPQQQGLLALGSQLMAAGAESTDPGYYKRTLAGAMPAYMNAMTAGTQAEQQKILQQQAAAKFQMQQTKAQREQEDFEQDQADRARKLEAVAAMPPEMQKMYELGGWGAVAPEKIPESMREIDTLYNRIKEMEPGDPHRSVLENRLSKITAYEKKDTRPPKIKTIQGMLDKVAEAKKSGNKNLAEFWQKSLDAEVSKSGMQLHVDPESGEVSFSTGGMPLLGGNLPTSKKTQAGLENKVLNAQAGLSRLHGVAQSFQPHMLTWETKLKAQWAEWTDKAGNWLGGLSPDQEGLLKDYTDFQVNTRNNLNLYIKEITGAQMSEGEAERIEGSVPNENMSPVQFKQAISTVVKNLKIAGMRAFYAATKGIEDPETFNKRIAPLGNMKHFIDARGDQILKQVKKENPSMGEEAARQQTRSLLGREFGVFK